MYIMFHNFWTWNQINHQPHVEEEKKMKMKEEKKWNRLLQKVWIHDLDFISTASENESQYPGSSIVLV